MFDVVPESPPKTEAARVATSQHGSAGYVAEIAARHIVSGSPLCAPPGSWLFRRPGSSISVSISSAFFLRDSLAAQKRKAVLLYYFEGMSDTEIAELLNTPRSTIQYRRTSSFEQLRKYLEENADEWDEW
ncbi:MAG: RNA polymerase sigma factor [Clostridium fessum]